MAFDEIDELGKSLLQRQRTTRKRTQKRIDKDQRNAMWLNIAGAGVGLANNYLRTRAENHVNNTEEFVGQKLLYNKGLIDRDYIISDYKKAAETPGGAEAYLIEKYKTPIKASLDRQFDMEKWDQDSIDTYVFTEAQKKAKEMLPEFEAAYQDALTMPDIDDYNSYIKSRDGRSENVGGFIFNSLSRMFNDRTQEDVDAELINEVENSRYGKSAAQMKTFRESLDAGYNTLEAKTFADSTPSQLGIQPKGVIVERLDRVTLDYEEFGDAKKIEVIQVTSTLNGKPHLSYRPFVQEDNEGNPVLDDDGNPIPVSPEAWKRFNMYRNGLPLNNEGAVAGVTFDNQPLKLVRDSEGREVPSYGIFGQRGRIFQDHWIEFFGGGIRSVGPEYFIPDSPLTLAGMQANIPEGVVERQAGLLRNATSQFRLGDNVTAQNIQLLGVSATYGVKDLERLDEDGRGDIQNSHINNLEVASAIKAMELSERYKIPLEQTQVLAAWQYLTSVATGYDPDEKTYRLNENFISVEEFPATTALVADSRIEADAFGLNVEIPEASYSIMTLEAISELDTPADASESDKVHLQAARDLLKQSNYFMSQYLNLSTEQAENENQVAEIEAIVDALNGSGIQLDENNNVSMVNIMRHLDGLGGADDASVNIDLSITTPAAIFRRLQDRVDVLEGSASGRQTATSPLILARKKIHDYVSDREDRIEMLSRTRTPQGRRREISEEQLIEIAQLEEEIAQFLAAQKTYEEGFDTFAGSGA